MFVSRLYSVCCNHHCGGWTHLSGLRARFPKHFRLFPSGNCRFPGCQWRFLTNQGWFPRTKCGLNGCIQQLNSCKSQYPRCQGRFLPCEERFPDCQRGFPGDKSGVPERQRRAREGAWNSTPHPAPGTSVFIVSPWSKPARRDHRGTMNTGKQVQGNHHGHGPRNLSPFGAERESCGRGGRGGGGWKPLVRAGFTSSRSAPHPHPCLCLFWRWGRGGWRRVRRGSGCGPRVRGGVRLRWGRRR